MKKELTHEEKIEKGLRIAREVQEFMSQDDNQKKFEEYLREKETAHPTPPDEVTNEKEK